MLALGLIVGLIKSKMETITDMINAEIDKINRMIQEQNDPSTKGLLLIILSMLNYERASESKMVDMVNQVKTDHNRRITDSELQIKAHDSVLTGYVNTMNKIKGAMYVITLLFMMTSGLSAYIFYQSIDYVRSLGMQVHTLELNQKQIIPKLDQVFKEKDNIVSEIKEIQKLKAIKASK